MTELQTGPDLRAALTALAYEWDKQAEYLQQLRGLNGREQIAINAELRVFREVAEAVRAALVDA